MRISTVCMPSVVGDIRGNLNRMEAYIREASSKGSDLVCFPELSLTGYSTSSSPGLAADIGDPAVGEVVDMSSDYSIAVCFGFVEDGPYITQVVAEGGRIAGAYRKTHLGEREAPVFAAGDSLPVIRTSKAAVGIQLCWESHIPQISTSYALHGADLILMPHASGLSGERRRSSWGRTLPARAYDNTVFVASCNAVGDNGRGTSFGGGTCVLDVRGNVIAEDYSGETMMTADLDPDDMMRIRGGNYSSMRDVYFLDKLRPELYD